MAGIEPATDGLRNRSSTAELHWHPDLETGREPKKSGSFATATLSRSEAGCKPAVNFRAPYPFKPGTSFFAPARPGDLKPEYRECGIALARDIHPAFVIPGRGVVWKMKEDLSGPYLG